MKLYLNTNNKKRGPIIDPTSGTHLSALFALPLQIPHIYEIVTSNVSILHEETEV